MSLLAVVLLQPGPLRAEPIPVRYRVPSKNSILLKSLRQCVLKRQRVLDPFRFVLIAVAGWMNQQQQFAIDYLREENRVLKEQLGRRRLRLNDISAVVWPQRPNGWAAGF
jgi:hypothetical protein